MTYKYKVAKPNLKGNERKYLLEAFDSGWLSASGPFIQRLEGAWANYIGTTYAVACSSGTTALMLSLAALGIGPGDEVIVPEFTMIASAWAVSYLGATPIFVDSAGLNATAEEIERKITKKTKAIMPVHIYGEPCEMVEIMKLAREYNIAVVEDACEAHGATVDGIKVGSFGDLGCFSLMGNKIITAGEGGLITTNSKRLYEQLIDLRSMAFDIKHTFIHKKVGYNFRMTNLQAAVGLAQVERIDEFLTKREQIYQWYKAELGDWIETINERPAGSVTWIIPLMCRSNMEKYRLKQELDKNGIESRDFFQPMSAQPMYFNPGWQNLFCADYSNHGLYLPAYVDLTKEDVKFICKIVKKSLQKSS